MRAIRGAITVSKNTKEEILAASTELLEEILDANKIKNEELVSIIFTATTDLDAVYPAVAAREMGLDKVPLLCFQEMKVEGALEKCLRVMVFIDRKAPLEEIKHVYLREAVRLRPDLYINNEKERRE
ncbi:MAG TPA: chorismate mutase [Halanaerobiaceae bacterium]|mgnify:CR=1 FL=1|jgi:chorismate mutase|nr:chorismate mutase [Bacillota bacterium]HHU93033.1 chorismate mutase [Halanaerobiaceae bacterium]HOA40224.1 chorismate mutase [Halanaerobiales bacterium]HPZ62377.1 chorismate mutase [Halanaerobiales bacterium]HQD03775.1 chorismate mutase [Halanaerobiales bacterium]